MNEDRAENARVISWVKGTRHHQLPIAESDDVDEPAVPVITVVRSSEELQNLPTETVITWTEGAASSDTERHAAVLYVEGEDVWVSHTGHSNWSTSIEHVRYPAQAFIWPPPKSLDRKGTIEP